MWNRANGVSSVVSNRVSGVSSVVSDRVSGVSVSCQTARDPF